MLGSIRAIVETERVGLDLAEHGEETPRFAKAQDPRFKVQGTIQSRY